MMVPVSSASPRALERYAQRGLAMDSELCSSAAGLRAALGRFRDSCREYYVDVEGLSEEVMRLANEGEQLDLRVRQVGRDFERADRSSRPWWRRILDFLQRIPLPSLPRISLPRVDWLWRREEGIPPWLVTAVSGVLSGVSTRRTFDDQLRAALGLPSIIIVWPWPPRYWLPLFWWDRRFRIMREVPRWLAKLAERILAIALSFRVSWWGIPTPAPEPVPSPNTPEREPNDTSEANSEAPNRSVLSQSNPVSENDSDLDQELWFGNPPVKRTIKWLIQKYGCLMTCHLMLRQDQGDDVDIYDIFCEFYERKTGRKLSDDLNDDNKDTPHLKSLCWISAPGERAETRRGDTASILRELVDNHGSVIINIPGTTSDGHWVIVDTYEIKQNGVVEFTIRDPLEGTMYKKTAPPLILRDPGNVGTNVRYLED